jgi:hypothetical protein
MEKKQELKERLDALAVDIVADPEKIKDLAARYKNGFHNYSLGNHVLIWSQKPAATLCAGFNTWKAKKRFVKAGEKAIWILAPMIAKKVLEKDDGEKQEVMRLFGFRAVPVFDVSQTEGEVLDMGANKAKFNGEEMSVEDVAKAFPEYEFKIVERKEDGIAYGEKIEVALRKNKAQMVHTYFHELAHILLGHTKKEKAVSRNVAELEAESTATIVAACLGIESPDAAVYIASWKGNQDSLETSAPKILSTADQILRRIKKGENNG